MTVGHGWVFLTPNAVRANCGRPGVCRECDHEAAIAEDYERRGEGPDAARAHLLAALGGSGIRVSGWRPGTSPAGERP